MRTAAAAIVICCALAAPAAAAPHELAGTWRGTWRNASMGTHGPARLLGGREPALRLAGPALGCAQPTRLVLGYRRGALTGHGRDIPCNEGLRWALHGRLAHGRIAATLTLRLADGSRARVVLELRRR